METPEARLARMEKSRSIPVGVIVQKRPSKHRWGSTIWMPVAVVPGAADADWRVLREEDGVVEYHATTVSLELFRGETEAYRLALSKSPPLVWVVLRKADEEPGIEVHCVTASPYEAQDYLDSGEDIVEAVAMSEGLAAWVHEFTEAHHEEEAFHKRQRDRVRTDRIESGRGDARIRQAGDVYRQPADLKPNGRR